MKRLIILASVIISTLFFASCNKNNLDPTPDPEDTWICTHDSLIHVPAVEPTETENGCCEHYYCSQCSKYFSDAGCTNEIESPIIWATSLVFGAEDYYDVFENAYYENGYASFLDGKGESNFIFSSILSSIIVDQATKAFDKLFGFAGGGSVNPVFKDIADNLSKIENAILGLTQMFKDEKIKDAINNREKNLFYVNNATHPYFMSVLNQIKEYKAVGEIPKEKMDNIRTLVLDWYDNGIYNGLTYDDCYIKISELMHFYNGYWTSSKTVPQLYDQIAYRSTPWCHQADKLCFMIRASDVITLSEAYLMTCLYFHFNNGLATTEKITQMNGELKNYEKVLKANPVDQQFLVDSLYTRWAWESKSKENDISSYKLYRDIWTFQKNGKWLIDERLDELMASQTYWNDSRVLESVYARSSENENHYGLTRAQQQCIWDYYKKSYGNNYYDMLTKAGFRGVFYERQIPDPSSGAITNYYGRLVCYNPSNYYSSKGCNQGWRWLCVDMSSWEKKHILFFRDVLNKEFNFIQERDQCAYRDQMTWGIADYAHYPTYLKDKGNFRNSNRFMALTRTGDIMPPL